MTMTWALTPVEGGARVDITAYDVPEGIASTEHAVGMASSLQHLERFVVGDAGGEEGTAASAPSAPRP